MTVPELSVVMVGRNDGYGGDFVGRLQTCLKTLAVGENLTGIAIEAVVVEWNPPSDHPSISDLVPDQRPSSVRVVTVPPTWHDRLDNPGDLPLFEYLGKNVGVRRASAETILVINPDVIVLPSVLTLARNRIVHDGAFVRIDRHDFRPPVPRHLSGEEVFAEALAGIFVNNRRPGSDGFVGGNPMIDPEAPVTSWPSSTPYPFEEEISPGLFLAREYHGVGQLHIGMPGDFLLASRATWHKVRGYWERTDTYTHLDTYLLAQLLGVGAPQAFAVAPYLILHEDHPRRMNGLADSWPDVEAACEELAQGARPLPNHAEWGFACDTFPEVALGLPALV